MRLLEVEPFNTSLRHNAAAVGLAVHKYDEGVRRTIHPQTIMMQSSCPDLLAGIDLPPILHINVRKSHKRLKITSY